jgi:HK97 family phage prohead protease
MPTTDLTYKSMAFEVKAVGDGGSFELYAAVFGNKDRQGEILAPGAFTNLPAFVKDGWGAVNHVNWNDDLGVAWIDEAVQDQIGLKVRGTFHSTDDAQRVRTKIKERMTAGKSVQCSFGFRVLDSATEIRDGEPVTILKAVEIFEFSFVNLAANPMAGVTAIKAANVMSVDEAKALASSLIEGVKAGRTISRANHAKLKGWASQLDEQGRSACQMAKELGEFLDAHDPDRESADEADSKAEPPPAEKSVAPAPEDVPVPSSSSSPSPAVPTAATPTSLQALRLRALRIRASKAVLS